MGDIKKSKKKYTSPRQPWNKARIEEEQLLLREYGLKNKREILKMIGMLKNFTAQAKKYVGLRTAQARTEEQQLVQRVQRLGLLGAEASIDSILGLTLRDILERRLQTQVYKKGLARSVKQARQFIVHKHVLVGEKKLTAPGHLTSLQEESSLSFSTTSSLNSIEHPERQIISESKAKKAKEATPTAPAEVAEQA